MYLDDAILIDDTELHSTLLLEDELTELRDLFHESLK
jgi:hypothetical protein